MTAPRILVVDDNGLLRELCREVFSARGCEVFLAADATDALRLAEAVPPDAAVLDMSLPSMSGIELCSALQALCASGGRRLDVWMITGGAEPELASRALAAGAREVRVKPFGMSDLCDVVIAAVRDRRSSISPAKQAAA